MYILITGANRGLGFELALEALKRGHNVIAGARNPAEKEGKLQPLLDKYSDQLQVVRLDVQDEDTIAAASAELRRQGISLDAIINNAAILKARDTRIEELDMKDVAESFDVNLFGPMRVVKHMLPLLAESEASVINISSEAGSLTNAYPNDYPYGITKTALNMFTLQLSSLLKDRGVQVLSVHPGWMRTDMGGEQAAMDPADSATGMLDLAERKTAPKSRYHFVKFNGDEMPI
ncbi:SDR family oxidoreductase [Paenibacillus physcomitrellae]|uniref:Short-chain dehydrogenase n=1 Tax=Paenibacillus physcomitrellae TaxID=1619311 RepID=A0ABQ1FTZ3_9BACL|nr:SDR family oxidoreductase [Paenibacillus physcomitrellae]GGA29958.1 short-chain dehydrogenase [Paenibacillus physcomitrellae]